MGRPLYVVGNWKMNTTYADAMVVVGEVNNNVQKVKNVTTIYLPPYIWIVPLLEKYPKINIGAQNMYYKEEGAYTGEISPRMLKGVVDYVLLGHSERRSIFKEDNPTINAKLKTALKFNFKPILAIGETRPIGMKSLTDEGISQRIMHSDIIHDLKASARGLTKAEWSRLIIAYEPVWAIGTGKNADGVYAARIVREIRDLIAQLTSREVADKIPILYGGSVNRQNAAEYAGQREIDGVLVGGASLKAKDFSDIVEAFGQSHKWRRDEAN